MKNDNLHGEPRYNAQADSTVEANYKDDPLAKSSRKHIVQPTLYTGKGVIEHDSRKGPLAGDDAKIERNQRRNNEHIAYNNGGPVLNREVDSKEAMPGG